MSLEASARVWRSAVAGEEKLVLLAIADHADPSGANAWPALDTLAVYASVSVRTVQRIIPRLSDAGWLTVHRNQGGSLQQRGDRRPNLYEIHLDQLPRHGVTEDIPDDSRGDSFVSPRSRPRGDKQSPRGDKTGPRGDRPVLKTGVERPLERPEEPPLPPAPPEPPRADLPEEVEFTAAEDEKTDTTLNASRALAEFIGRQPLDLPELLEHATRVGAGNPWAGYLALKRILDIPLPDTAHSPAALMRHRIGQLGPSQAPTPTTHREDVQRAHRAADVGPDGILRPSERQRAPVDLLRAALRRKDVG